MSYSRTETVTIRFEFEPADEQFEEDWALLDVRGGAPASGDRLSDADAVREECSVLDLIAVLGDEAAEEVRALGAGQYDVRGFFWWEYTNTTNGADWDGGFDVESVSKASQTSTKLNTLDSGLKE